MAAVSAKSRDLIHEIVDLAALGFPGRLPFLQAVEIDLRQLQHRPHRLQRHAAALVDATEPRLALPEIGSPDEADLELVRRAYARPTWPPAASSAKRYGMGAGTVSSVVPNRWGSDMIEICSIEIAVVHCVGGVVDEGATLDERDQFPRDTARKRARRAPCTAWRNARTAWCRRSPARARSGAGSQRSPFHGAVLKPGPVPRIACELEPGFVMLPAIGVVAHGELQQALAPHHVGIVGTLAPTPGRAIGMRRRHRRHRCAARRD